jgi:dihydrodipicolinate synthase/N-acetylneuraminate lyase
MTSKPLPAGYLVSVPVPWDERGRLLPDVFRGAVRKLLGEGCDGIYLFGTSGEGYAVSDDEFAQLVELLVDETRGFAGFRQVGCFGLGAEQVKRRVAMAVDRGVVGVQITLPFWKELNDREVAAYFNDVCSAFPQVSFLLYNNPRNKRRLTGKEIEAIHQRVPNLEAAKTGSGNWLEFYELVRESPGVRHFVTEPAYLFCRELGAAGLIPSSNYARPRVCRRYFEAVNRGDLSTAAELHRQAVAFFHQTAVPLVKKGYIDGAIDKAYARIGGMEMPLAMKAPYEPLSPDDFAWLERTVHEQFPDDD